jgi:UDP-2,4-diacetamido-2,4,6-trideoxy-beta-L-altropyranose hydrolase
MPTAVFRVDASLEIGTGHVMRCVVLANALAQLGWRSEFLMREEPGHLADWVIENGHGATLLCATGSAADAQPVLDAVRGKALFDWLVVDHYGLDKTWEDQVRGIAARQLVVDDLANRQHHCDLLLDQNAGRMPDHYGPLLPPAARRLLGPRYALMAPAFQALRDTALARRDRAHPPLRLLLSMGGVDRDNHTGRVLEALNAQDGPMPSSIDVVLGRHAPHIHCIRSRLATMRAPTRMHVDTRSMARLMCDADVAIGAGGISVLERCILGLPSITIAVADNQVPGSLALQKEGAIHYIGTVDDIEAPLIEAWQTLQASDIRQQISQRASRVCDGDGANRVALLMGEDIQ